MNPSNPSPAPAQTAPVPSPIPQNGITGSAGFILHLFLLLATAAVGIGISAMRTVSVTEVRIAEAVSAAAILLLVIHLWRSTRAAKFVLPMLVAVGAMMADLTHSLIPSGGLCGTVFAISEGSVLAAVQPRRKLALLPLIPMAAYVATVLVSGDPVGAVAVLVPYPPMAVLALGTRRSAAKEDGPTRVGVICATALALGLSMGAMMALSVYRHLGTLEPSVLLSTLDSLRDGLIASITAIQPPEGLKPEALAEMEEMLSYDNVQNLVNSCFNLIPGLLAVSVLVLSAACQALQHAALTAFGYGDSVAGRVKDFRMSLIACLVFLAAYLVAFLENGSSSSLAGTVAENLYVILLPGLALAGVLRIFRGMARRRSMGCLFYLIILIPCLFLFAPFLLAAIEVIGHIFEAITSRIKPPEEDDPF